MQTIAIFKVSLISFGFGVLNADEIASSATEWKNVPPGEYCEIYPPAGNNTYPGVGGDVLIIPFDASNCSINYVEHVEWV